MDDTSVYSSKVCMSLLTSTLSFGGATAFSLSDQLPECWRLN